MRGKKAKIRKIAYDYKYNSDIVMSFINLVMRDGKKLKAEKIVYSVMDNIAKETKKEPLVGFLDLLDKARPSSILKPRRMGGSNIQVPVAVDRQRGLMIAIRWILNYSRKRKGASIVDKLSKEFADINAGVGDVLKKKEEVHKMAEANKAFAYIR